MSILIVLFNGIILFGLAYRLFKQDSEVKSVYWLALALKLIAGIVLGLIYTYYYTIADTLGFFEDATKFSALARENIGSYLNFLWTSDSAYPFWSHLNFTQPRSLFVSKITSMFCLLTADNYWVITLYFSFFSFVCSWKLVNTIVRYFPESKAAAVISFLFMPSVVFWGSGLLKECLAIGSLFYMSHIYLKIWFDNKVRLFEMLFCIICLWILWQVKYYYAAVFIPVGVTSLLVKFISPRLKIKSSAIETVLWFVVFTAPLFLISLTKQNFHFNSFYAVVVKNYYAFQSLSKPEGMIYFNNLSPNGWSVLSHVPWAVVSGLLRPFVWEATNIFQLVASFENLLLLFFILTSFMDCKKSFQSEHRLLITALIVYTLLLCIFLTLSTPNFGSLSRYRIGFLPYLFFLLTANSFVLDRLSEIVQRSFSRLVR